MASFIRSRTGSFVVPFFGTVLACVLMVVMLSGCGGKVEGTWYKSMKPQIYVYACTLNISGDSFQAKVVRADGELFESSGTAEINGDSCILHDENNNADITYKLSSDGKELNYVADESEGSPGPLFGPLYASDWFSDKDKASSLTAGKYIE